MDINSECERIAKTFEFLDWLDACECGGIKAPPHIIGVTGKKKGNKILVDVAYHYDAAIHPYSDVIYHTYYDPKDIYHDIFSVSADGMIKVEEGHENERLIGYDDIFYEYRSCYKEYVEKFEETIKYAK